MNGCIALSRCTVDKIPFERAGSTGEMRGTGEEQVARGRVAELRHARCVSGRLSDGKGRILAPRTRAHAHTQKQTGAHRRSRHSPCCRLGNPLSLGVIIAQIHRLGTQIWTFGRTLLVFALLSCHFDWIFFFSKHGCVFHCFFSTACQNVLIPPLHQLMFSSHNVTFPPPCS